MKVYDNIFDGNLGTWTGKTYDLPMKKDVEPHHNWEFPVIKIHELTLTTEIDGLVKLGVWRKVKQFPMASSYIYYLNEGYNGKFHYWIYRSQQNYS